MKFKTWDDYNNYKPPVIIPKKLKVKPGRLDPDEAFSSYSSNYNKVCNDFDEAASYVMDCLRDGKTNSRYFYANLGYLDGIAKCCEYDSFGQMMEKSEDWMQVSRYSFSKEIYKYLIDSLNSKYKDADDFYQYLQTNAGIAVIDIEQYEKDVKERSKFFQAHFDELKEQMKKSKSNVKVKL